MSLCIVPSFGIDGTHAFLVLAAFCHREGRREGGRKGGMEGGKDG